MRLSDHLTSYDAADLMQVNTSSIGKWCNDGMLPHFRTPGGHRRIVVSDIIAFMRRFKMPLPERLERIAPPIATPFDPHNHRG